MENFCPDMVPPLDDSSIKGFTLLRNKQFKKAEEVFLSALDSMETTSDNYYGLALAALRGKGAYGCYRETIDKANNYLDEAIEIEEKGIYYYFKAFIAFDYFEFKHFKVSPSSKDYLRLAREHGVTQEEINELYGFLFVSCPKELRL